MNVSAACSLSVDVEPESLVISKFYGHIVDRYKSYIELRILHLNPFSFLIFLSVFNP
jgi:hypothetical protein